MQRALSATILLGAALWACTDHTDPDNSGVVLQNHSVTPVLLKKKTGFENLELFSLIGSDDVLPQSPGFVFGGSADGSGLLKNADGTFSMLINHEDNFSVSRITLDKTFKPVKGEYILNSDGGQYRLCSATMATPKEHGFGPVYLTCGESSEESQIHALDPYSMPGAASTSRTKSSLGRQNAEQALPLPKTAYTGKTVIIVGDDDSGTNGGQVFMYMADQVGDLDNGSYYTMRRKDLNQREMDMKEGQKYAVEFVKIEDQKTLTGHQMNQKVDTELKSIKFGRVEDVDYRKDGIGRELYFNVTGQNNTGVNADYSRTKYGRTYRLVLDANNPLNGQLEVILDGDDRSGKAKTFQDVDNICVTKNYVYVQEDPNGYGDEKHDSYIYQYNIATGELKVVLEIDHHRTAADKEKYNQNESATQYVESRLGSWEYGSMVDISEATGQDATFMLMVQPHSWRSSKYAGVDGGSIRKNENQASQVVIIRGLPR
ncbi:hypothetical protein [Siphonobacter sp. SORGH_AS_1065]|uniref:hypothetical protein n=1 Tax=Siphonobacter sp. SORGH_AS_1065 TaxID=3041795 RepID=UPI00278901F8|nr:hypothetical protein [Siphonobacter sp. SORGH_AS_1065]MDQ1090052.1 hypothetical protein [Siphonobacter sp. SORGH_AS_1065]